MIRKVASPLAREVSIPVGDGAILGDPDTTTLSEYMSLNPVTAGPEEDSLDVALRMVPGGFRHLPAVENDKLIGMVSARVVLQVEAWPPARFRRQTGAASINHPVRPRRHRVIEQGTPRD